MSAKIAQIRLDGYDNCCTLFAERSASPASAGNGTLSEMRGICMSSSTSLKAKILVVASAAIVVVPFVPTPAESHSFSAASTITINRQGNRYFGSIASARGSCKRNRSVTLFRTKNGRTRVAKRTTSNSNGNWSATARRKGRFQAVVSARTRGSYPHSHTCRGDRSPSIRRR